jgi:hypothetical protein
MTPSFSSKGSRRYRYYVCTRVLQRNDAACRSRWLAATPLEQHVVEQLRELACAPDRSPQERTWLAAVADPAVWQGLTTPEQAAVLRRLVARVEYDGHQGTVRVTLRPVPPADQDVPESTPEAQP